jgi:hypothetical protein
MKTEVIMKRELFGVEISQKSKSEFLSATDLVKAGNKWRRANNLTDFNLSQWLSKETTKEFINELTFKYGKCLIKGRGRVANTWVHPFLFIDIALAISPKLKIETYEWLYDYLLHYRNTSGDSFKKMSGALYHNCSNKREFQEIIKDTSRKIKKACNINDWEDWQKASQNTLEKRDKIHENIALLCDILPLEEAVRIGILKTN